MVSRSQITLGSEGQSIDLRLVAHEGMLQLHCVFVPNLDLLVPGASRQHSIFLGREAHLGNPVSVLDALALVNCVLAVSLDIPELNSLVSGA